MVSPDIILSADHLYRYSHSYKYSEQCAAEHLERRMSEKFLQGFTFSNINAGDMVWVLREAVDLYLNNKKAWRGLQKEDMTADFSWTNSAKQYLDIYQRILG